jgi:hypothetical protein
VHPLCYAYSGPFLALSGLCQSCRAGAAARQKSRVLRTCRHGFPAAAAERRPVDRHSFTHGCGMPFQMPVIVEFIFERATNIATGTEIDKITEFEDLAQGAADAPTAIALLD